MPTPRIFTAAALSCGILVPFCSLHASPREQHPNTVRIEVLGRSLVYGLQYERSWTRRWSTGAGFAHVDAGAESGENRPSTALIPVYIHYALREESPCWSVTGGLTWVSNAAAMSGKTAILGSLRFPSTPLLPHLGVGYSIRQGNGFAFRWEGLLTRGDSPTFSTGFSLGYAF